MKKAYIINNNSHYSTLTCDDFSGFKPDNKHSKLDKLNIVITIHVFYIDVFEEILEVINNIKLTNPQLLISTDTKDKVDFIENRLKGNKFKHKIKVLKNIGRDIAPSFIGFRDEILESDLFLHLHTKKSEYNPDLNMWRSDILFKLLGSEKIAKQNLKMILRKNVGAIIPAPPDFIKAHINWGTKQDFKLTKRLLKRSNIKINNSNPLYFPAGSMFFAKTECIKPMIESLRIEDFSEESGQISGTMAHAVERSILFYVEKSGKKWIEVDISKSGSYNYRCPEYSLLKKHRLILLCIKLKLILKNFKNFCKINVHDR